MREDMCEHLEGKCRKYSGSAQTMLREWGETYRLRTRGSGLTATEKTPRGERTCANSERTHRDNVQKYTDNGNEVDNDDKSVVRCAPKGRRGFIC